MNISNIVRHLDYLAGPNTTAAARIEALHESLSLVSAAESELSALVDKVATVESDNKALKDEVEKAKKPKAKSK